MKQWKKQILPLFLAVLMLFPGCGETPTTEKEQQKTEQQETEATVLTEEEEYDGYAELSDPTLQSVAKMIRGHESNFQIVRSDGMSSTQVNILSAFSRVVTSNAPNKIKVVTDDEKLSTAKETEIILGSTKREGTYYTLPAEAQGLVDGDYRFDILEKRVVISFGGTAGLTNALEDLIFILCKGTADSLRVAYAEALQAKGIQRYESFSLSNYFMDGMTLQSGDLTVFGTASAGNTIAVKEYCNGTEVLVKEVEADKNGKWKTVVSCRENADEFRFFVNSTQMLKYTGIQYVDEVLESPARGIRVLIDGVDTKAYVSAAGSVVIASPKSATAKSMEVEILYRHTTVKVLPTSAGIDYTSDGSSVKFTVSTFPSKLSVEFNNQSSVSVQLFLYPYDDTDVTELSGNVMYFAPGVYSIDEYLTFGQNQTVYLDEGAVLHAKISTTGSNNLKITGKGIFDVFTFEVETFNLVFTNCKNVTLENFTLVGDRKWMIQFSGCDGCEVNRVNILGTAINSDGVDICNSSNVTVDGCYIRANDDCIALKSLGTDPGRKNVEHIKIINCVLFNDVYGNAMEIGFESTCDKIDDVLFENNDVIHSFGGSIFSIHVGDHALVSNVTYRNIRVEEVEKKLIEFYIKESQYSKETTRGKIQGVTFENISIAGDTFGSISITGFDETHNIDGVSFSNVTFNGNAVEASKANVSTNNYVSNLTWNGSKLK